MSRAVQSHSPSHKSSGGQIYWICRGVFIEAVRRREIFVVLLFAGLFVVGAITARMMGTESDAAAAFILNLGLSLVWIMGMVLAILIGARQFPDELETRSLYPLLAKPVQRHQYIVGKWLATSLAAGATVLVLNALSVAASPWPAGLSPALLAQAVILELFAISAAAAIALALSIRLPKSLTVVITGLLVFAAAPLMSLLLSRIAPGPARSAAQWVAGYVPNISRLDLLNGFSAGAGALGFSDMLSLMAYGAVLTLFSLAVATVLLERRSL